MGSIITLLNSLSFYGKYKQKWPEQVETIEFYHSGVDLKQNYSDSYIYRNVNWIFGTTNDNKISSMSGGVLYRFILRKENARDAIIISDKGDGCFALPPFSALKLVLI